jgi:hypothetical protein
MRAHRILTIISFYIVVGHGIPSFGVSTLSERDNPRWTYAEQFEPGLVTWRRRAALGVLIGWVRGQRLIRLTARKRGADTLGMMADSIVCCRPTGLSRRAGLWCTLLLILAVIAMRGPALFRVGLWRDEAATHLYATAPTPGAFIDLIRHVEANPPGFFYLMFVWVHAFGSAPAVLKLPSFAFSLVLIWLTYELGQRRHSPRVGLCAAVLIAVAPISTFVSIQGRAYALAACLCTLIVLLYERACADPTTRRLSWLALVAAAALYVHYTAIPFLVAICVGLPADLR